MGFWNSRGRALLFRFTGVRARRRAVGWDRLIEE
jgi:hypothetical protein